MGGTMIEWPATGAARIEPSSYKPTARFRVQLIVTGTITSGRFNLPSRLVRNTYGTLETNALTLTNNNASITAQACSVQTPAIAVTMPQARFADLPRIGSTTGATGFRIDLNCSGPVSISVTLIDASHPANRSSTLSAASTSTAEGVAYQILHHGRLVHYGAESAVAGNENQFLAATVAGAGITTLPFIVRYVREGRVSAGTVNANATFTMNYQ
jgi:type 1 fimbria pilin